MSTASREQAGAILSLLALLTLLLAAPATVLADGPDQAGLVVQLGDGRVITRCVTLETEQIRGAQILEQSGLTVTLDPASGMGVTVCQIEGTGCAFPTEDCFCRCRGGGECSYWNYYYRDPGQSEWVYSAMGAAMRQVRPGSVEAWLWGQGQAAPAAELTFEAVCPPPTAEPTASPLAEPTAPGAATAVVVPGPTGPASVAVEVPAAAPTVTAPTATPAAAGNGPSLRSYGSFALMVFGMALMGVLLLRRRAR